MKTLLILFTLTLCIHADYLNTKTNNHCIYNIVPNQDNTGLCYTDRQTEANECDSNLNYSYLIDGYMVIDSNCVQKNDLKITGLTQNQWSIVMSILAHIMGFTMLFLVNFLAILISRK